MKFKKTLLSLILGISLIAGANALGFKIKPSADFDSAYVPSSILNGQERDNILSDKIGFGLDFMLGDFYLDLSGNERTYMSTDTLASTQTFDSFKQDYTIKGELGYKNNGYNLDAYYFHSCNHMTDFWTGFDIVENPLNPSTYWLQDGNNFYWVGDDIMTRIGIEGSREFDMGRFSISPKINLAYVPVATPQASSGLEIDYGNYYHAPVAPATVSRSVSQLGQPVSLNGGKILNNETYQTEKFMAGIGFDSEYKLNNSLKARLDAEDNYYFFSPFPMNELDAKLGLEYAYSKNLSFEPYIEYSREDILFSNYPSSVNFNGVNYQIGHSDSLEIGVDVKLK